MSQQRKRHNRRQSIEEDVRSAMSDFLGNSGEVDIERHSYDWRPDDLLVWLRLLKPIGGSVLALFRHQVAGRMRGLLPAGTPLGDWLVVAECKGETLATVAWHDKLEESGRETGD